MSELHAAGAERSPLRSRRKEKGHEASGRNRPLRTPTELARTNIRRLSCAVVVPFAKFANTDVSTVVSPSNSDSESATRGGRPRLDVTESGKGNGTFTTRGTATSGAVTASTWLHAAGA